MFATAKPFVDEANYRINLYATALTLKKASMMVMNP